MQLRHAARIAFVLCGLLAAACEPEATPLPVILPTLPSAATATPLPETQPLRYALAPDVANFLSADDERLISADALILPLDAPPTTDALGTDYEILVALSAFPESSEAPAPLRVVLRLNTALAPLDDPEIAAIVRQAVNPQTFASALGFPTEQSGDTPAPETLRASLANAGYPDGFDLTLATDFTADAETIMQNLSALRLEVRLATADEDAHLTLTSAPSSAESSSEIIELLTVPIYYSAVPGLDVKFTPAGFPIISR